jgi:tetratricopeptide (TPR) repeat protein
VFTAGDYAQAEAIAERVMALTAHQGDAQWRRAFRLRAGIQHGFYTGDLARGEAEFRAWREIQDGAYRHRAPGDDVLSIGIAGLIAEVDGRHAVGGQRIDAAFVSAAARGPYDLAMALHTAACFHHFARDAAGLADSAARLSELAQERGFEFADHLATGWLAIADANAGRAASALARVRAAIAGFDRLKARVSLVFWHGVLGRARWLNGDAEAAAEAFAAALSLNDQERIFRPDVMLERAAVLAAMGRVGDAERELRAVARLSSDIGAPLFQVRALVALGQAQLVKGDRAALRRALRAAQAVAGERPGLCPHDRAHLERLAQEAGFDDRPAGAKVRAPLKA